MKHLFKTAEQKQKFISQTARRSVQHWCRRSAGCVTQVLSKNPPDSWSHGENIPDYRTLVEWCWWLQQNVGSGSRTKYEMPREVFFPWQRDKLWWQSSLQPSPLMHLFKFNQSPSLSLCGPGEGFSSGRQPTESHRSLVHFIFRCFANILRATVFCDICLLRLWWSVFIL